MDKHCVVCGDTVDAVETILESGPHYSSFRCPICKTFLGFGKKPKNEGKRDKNKHSPSSLGIDHCQLCLRHKSRLGPRGVLAVHHIDEIHSGGLDIPENIWVVCTSCHTLIHHQRTYLNTHLTNQFSFNDLQEGMDKYNIPAETQDALKRLFQLNEAVR